MACPGEFYSKGVNTARFASLGTLVKFITWSIKMLHGLAFENLLSMGNKPRWLLPAKNIYSMSVNLKSIFIRVIGDQLSLF